MASSLRYVLCDVFTDRPLEGNQLCVFTDAREIPEAMLQQLAREVNYSETVFCYPAEQGGHARIRIFTPQNELPFAGHPVLGTAFVLAAPMQLAEIRLETGMGIVPIALEREQDRLVFGRMTQPVPSIVSYAAPEKLLAALGAERSRVPVELYDNGVPHVYVGLDSVEALVSLEPDLQALERLARGSDPIVGFNVFAGSGLAWKLRVFAPADGVPEDPATGSAAGPLALHLCRHGLVPFGEEVVVSQGAEIGRPSTLYARVDGTAEQVERIEVGGSAVTVARGEYRL
jgi:trans-2,3-dihydro-3-hydroxyanthranilate isomerase